MYLFNLMTSSEAWKIVSNLNSNLILSDFLNTKYVHDVGHIKWQHTRAPFYMYILTKHLPLQVTHDGQYIFGDRCFISVAFMAIQEFIIWYGVYVIEYGLKRWIWQPSDNSRYKPLERYGEEAPIASRNSRVFPKWPVTWHENTC